MATYFVDKNAVGAHDIQISGDLHHHLSHVLRMKVGAQIVVSDNVDTVYHGTICEMSKGHTSVTIEERTGLTTEPPFAVHLIQSLPKGDKMEQIIQRGTELGVSDFWPVTTDHSDVRLRQEKVGVKQLRWQKIAAASAEQCGRGRIPIIHRPRDLAEAIADLPLDIKLLFFYEFERQQDLKDALSGERATNYGIIIGPEGGFSEEEAAYLKQVCGTCLSMGPRILRTETAGPAAVAVLLYEKGDWGERP